MSSSISVVKPVDVSEQAVPGIRLRAVTKRFGPVLAVDHVDLDVADGELFAVLGPSGSGKTTVLRMIAGFEAPTEGAIELSGVDATRQPPFRRDVNTVFQDYALFPHLNVEQNVGYGLRVKRVARTERAVRVRDALDMVRLADMGARRPSELSGGQRQRVALARALVNRPRVLLLDEPLGALDLKLREQMQVELKAIQREVGSTFVFVTHDQDEALTLCDRLAVMREGRIEQVGAAAEVYESPATQFVAQFVGTSNLISGDAAKAILGDNADVVAIRPEKIRVVAGAVAPRIGAAGVTPAPREVAVSGRIREIVYAGSQTRVVADAEHGLTLSALLLNATLTAPDLHRGDHVTLVWDRDAVRPLSN